MRHPVYLAEIVMSAGSVITDLRSTMLIGEFAFVLLQMTRIHAEETLLGNTFPAYQQFQARTPYRLAPGVW